MSLNQDTGAESTQSVACFVKMRKLVNQTITSTYGGDEVPVSLPDQLTKVGTISCRGWVETCLIWCLAADYSFTPL